MKTSLALLCSLVVPFTAWAEHQGKLQILLLGDSTTEAKIPKQLEPKAPQLENIIENLLARDADVPPTHVINSGLSGEYIRRLLGRYDSQVAKLPGLDYIFIRYGINDFARLQNFETDFPNDFHELIARLRADHPGAVLVPTTVLPHRDTDTSRKINELVKQVATAENLPLFDLFPRYLAELKRGPDMLNYRRFPLADIPENDRAFVRPYIEVGTKPMVVMLDNRLDAHFGHLPGWFGDRHPNLAGYHVIADETAKFLMPLLRGRAATAPRVVAAATMGRAVDRNGLAPLPVFAAPGHCAWPNLKLLADKRTLAAFIFNDESHGHHPGDIECWLSGDGGASWKLGSAVTQHEPQTIRMNHAAGLARNGELVVLTSGWSNLWPPNQPRSRGSFRYEVLRPWVSRSPDGGQSWSVSYDGFPAATPGGQPATPFGDLQTAQNGDLCAVAYAPQGPWEKYEERRFRAWLYRSKDDGLTWGDPVVLAPEANETNALHLGGGRWLACARGGTGVEKKDYLSLYASIDDGRTWTFQYDLTGFQRVNGHLAKLRDGRVLFSYGDRASGFGRKGLEAMISTDGGGTWSDPVRLVDWNGLDGGYPSSVQRADGQVVTAYYASAMPGEAPDSAKGYHMEVIAWDPEKSFPLK